jgi:hypothetical protein
MDGADEDRADEDGDGDGEAVLPGRSNTEPATPPAAAVPLFFESYNFLRAGFAGGSLASFA